MAGLVVAATGLGHVSASMHDAIKDKRSNSVRTLLLQKPLDVRSDTSAAALADRLKKGPQPGNVKLTKTGARLLGFGSRTRKAPERADSE